MKKAKTWLLAALTLLCMAMAMRAASGVEKCYPGMGLRYHAPLTGQQVATALERTRTAQEKAAAVQDSGGVPGSDTLYPTFWCEATKTVNAAYASVQVTAVGCLGEAARAWPAELLAGNWPGQLQENACAVSDAAAQALWGSTDILGQTLRCGTAEYLVCGIFHDSRPVWVYTAEQTEGFTAVELAGPDNGNERQTALGYAMYSGLGTPDSIIYGNSMAALARGAALLPLWLAGVALLIAFYKRCPAKRKRLGLWVLLGLLALLLPRILSGLPGWLIPSQWSDFDFWGRLFQAGTERIREWFLLAPQTKDAAAKLYLLATAAWTAASVFAESICLIALSGTCAERIPRRLSEELKS
jgi:hypothetical protein